MRKNATILVVEDEEDMLKGLTKMLTGAGYDVVGLADGVEAVQMLDTNVYDAVITDLKLPGFDGLEILKKLKEVSPDSVGILITGYGTVRSAVEAMKLGAYDFISKPFDLQKLKIVLRNALEQSSLRRENKYLKEKINHEWQVDHIVGKSRKMQEVFEAVRKVAPTNATVLILGESGTGKELIARYVHHLSPRRDKLFSAVNCGVLRDMFLESELFGHVKGAYTGAVKSRRGLLEITDGGTFFLDELAEVSLPVQAKLLRVLEEQKFVRFGGTEPIRVDVRLVGATNKNLEACMEEGKFRDDLYYRLNVFAIHLPPLRERKEDISLLAYHFLKKHARKLGRRLHDIQPAAMDALVAYDWPGNVRELEKTIERGIILESGDTLRVDNLPGKLISLSSGGEKHSGIASYKEAKKAFLDKFNLDFVTNLLKKHGGNVTRAAQEAEMDRANFQRLMRNAGVTSRQFS